MKIIKISIFSSSSSSFCLDLSLSNGFYVNSIFLGFTQGKANKIPQLEFVDVERGEVDEEKIPTTNAHN